MVKSIMSILSLVVMKHTLQKNLARTMASVAADGSTARASLCLALRLRDCKCCPSASNELDSRLNDEEVNREHGLEPGDTEPVDDSRCPCAADTEARVRAISFATHGIYWCEAAVRDDAYIGCGFESADAYREFSASDVIMSAWVPVSSDEWHMVHSTRTLLMTCSFSIDPRCQDIIQQIRDLVACVISSLRNLKASNVDEPVLAVKPLLFSNSPRLPMLPMNLQDLTIAAHSLQSITMSSERGSTMTSMGDAAARASSPSSSASALSLLLSAGLFVVRNAVHADVAERLLSLVSARIRHAESTLLEQHGHDLSTGAFQFAEVCARGKCRFDLLLYADGMLVGGETADHGATTDGKELLEQVCTSGAWVPTVCSALGVETPCWQASVICSRAGAPAGNWHADAGHSRYTFNGESTPAPPAVCVFVPLVALTKPQISRRGTVLHGRGCTAFWPGSHRYPECLHLGAAAASKMKAIIPGAPLSVGDALVYDYRVVHAGSPNEFNPAPRLSGPLDSGDSAHSLRKDERPIMQITYYRSGFRDRSRNYGFDELFA